MQYKDFVTNLAEDLQEEFEKRNRNVDVDIIKVEKAWGTELGIKVLENRNYGPVFYPKEQYENFENGRDYFSMLKQLADFFESTLGNTPIHDDFDLTSLKDSITMRLVDTKRSHKYLKDKPHREFEDLSIVYQLNTVLKDNSKGCIVVTLDMMEKLGLDEEGIYQFAMEKAPVNSPYRLKPMSAVIGDLLDEDEVPSCPLMVLTNDEADYGASVVVYPNILEQCAVAMNGDFFIIPSSVHECLLHPDNNQVSLEQLKFIVKEVNDTQLSPEELLSYSVYHYDHEGKIFELAEKYEARMREKQSLMGKLEEKKKDVVRESHLRRNQDIGSRRVQGGSLCL